MHERLFLNYKIVAGPCAAVGVAAVLNGKTCHVTPFNPCRVPRPGPLRDIHCVTVRRRPELTRTVAVGARRLRNCQVGLVFSSQ